MKEIKNKISSQKLVKWRALEWLQNDNLKEIGEESLTKLKNSLKNNDFIQPFNVWEDKKKKLWILDGVHRFKAMTELEKDGIKIPDMLPANLVNCKNRKDAAKMVLIYSSSYAKLSEFGLKEYLALNDLVLSDIENEIDVDVDLSLLVPEYKFPDETDLDMNTEKKPLADVYVVVGEFRILIERNKYLTWVEEMKHEVGFDQLSILTEIKRRLQLP